VGENLPDTVTVASRKPSMSFIYSKGKDFYGIYRFPVETPDDLIAGLRENYNDIVAVPNEIIAGFPVGYQVESKQYTIAYIVEGNDIYGVYDYSDGFRELLGKVPGSDGSLINVDTLLLRLQFQEETVYAVSPDSLLQTLKDNSVDYVILANLRAVPSANTGRTINTVQRYLFFIEQKYPGLFNLVQQTGVNENEPAWLYMINYEYYGL